MGNWTRSQMREFPDPAPDGFHLAGHKQNMILFPAVLRSRCCRGTYFAHASQPARKSVPGPPVSPTSVHLKNTRPLLRILRSSNRQSLQCLSPPAGPKARTMRFGCCSFENLRSASSNHNCCAASCFRWLISPRGVAPEGLLEHVVDHAFLGIRYSGASYSKC